MNENHRIKNLNCAKVVVNICYNPQAIEMMIITYYLSFYMLITGVTMFNDTSWMTEIILLYSKVAQKIHV